LSVVSGDNQAARAYTQLAQPVVVQLLTSKGKPIKGQVVTFRTLYGTGSVFAGAAITDANGFARDWWTLGDGGFENALEARTVDPVTGERIVFATSFATAVLWTAPEIQCKLPGQTFWGINQQTGEGCPQFQNTISVPNGASIQLQFRLRDNGVVVPNAPVDFIVTGGGRIAPGEVLTDADGVVTVTFTAGPTKILNTIQAWVPGLPQDVLFFHLDIKAGY